MRSMGARSAAKPENTGVLRPKAPCTRKICYCFHTVCLRALREILIKSQKILPTF